MHILLGLLLFLVAAWAANITGDPDMFGWVILASVFTWPALAILSFIVGTLIRAIFGDRSNR